MNPVPETEPQKCTDANDWWLIEFEWTYYNHSTLAAGLSKSFVPGSDFSQQFLLEMKSKFVTVSVAQPEWGRRTHAPLKKSC